MIDKNGRSIDYLRISITDRCNLRCMYCMPEEGVGAMEHAQILSFEEIVRIVRIMTGLGILHLRLTGGEPMARRGCLDLARRLHEIPGIESISMTSNGILLMDKVRQAKESGISSLNISIDALKGHIFMLADDRKSAYNEFKKGAVAKGLERRLLLMVDGERTVVESAVSTPYDDAFRTLVNDCARLLIPVINEVFGKHYSGVNCQSQRADKSPQAKRGETLPGSGDPHP